MTISVNYSTAPPWLITIPKADLTIESGTKYILTVDAFWLLLRDFTDNQVNMARPKLYSRIRATASTPSITEIESLSYELEFEDGLYSVNIVDGNTNIRDVEVKNQVSVNTNNTTGFVDQSFLEHGTFNGGVTIDTINGLAGTDYPIGTPATPVSKVSDALLIIASRGFSKIFIVGSLTIGSGDFSEGITFIGQNATTSEVILQDPANVNNCEFQDLKVSGIADDSNEFNGCSVGQVSSYDGTISNSRLVGQITLGGTSQTTINNCITTNQVEVTISIGSGSALIVGGHNGDVRLSGKTGTDVTKINMASGRVTIDATCTAGVIEVWGNGELVDNSGSGCVIIDKMLNGGQVTNIIKTIELLRPHHTGSGKVIFWDPYSGNDANQGDAVGRATKTFAQAHTLATDTGHDIIICIAGDPSGNTVTTENCVITKNYLFVRSMGRDFTIKSTNDLLPAIDIQANGCEVSSMQVITNVTNTVAAIKSSGAFPLLKDLYIGESANGILVNDGEFGIIDNCRVSHGTGYGIKVEGNSAHAAIRNSHLGTNTNGVEVDLTTGHEVTISNTTIHGNSGYGVDISANSSGVHLLGDVTMFGNTLGDVNDLGTGTYDAHNEIADLHAAHFNRRKQDDNDLTITVYEKDDVTARRVFDIDAPDARDITPQ